jgi:5'-AMP-activated protein kinase regulatory gamma subunit
MFSERSISAVPIIDEEGVVVNLYETVDVIVSYFFKFITAQDISLQ